MPTTPSSISQLARHYGLVGVSGSEMRRVPLTDHNRGGVLTLGSVLTLTSYPLRTSPVLRGRWVLEQVLGGKVPPPPPNVPQLPRDESMPASRPSGSSSRPIAPTPPVPPATCGWIRSVSAWRILARPAVGGPIIPWWAIRDSIPMGPTVDASGTLPSGEKFAGPAELKTLILARKDEFLRHFVRKMFGYALGRELNKADDCAVADTLKALAENQYRSSVLVDRIVQSYPFQHRFREP